MKTDCLMELERLYKAVIVKIHLGGIALSNLVDGIGNKTEWEIYQDIDIDILNNELFWQPGKYSLPTRFSYELKANLMEATDKRQVIDTYRREVEKRIVDEDKAQAAYTAEVDKIGVREPTRGRYLHQMGMMLMCYREGVILPILGALKGIEKDYLGEPQPGSKRPLMQITQAAKDGLKPYFISTFKGMGNNNPDRFNENLIPELQRCKTKKEIAALALACYNSGSMIQDRKPSWNKWLTELCNLFSIDRLPYKMSELPPPDYDIKYYWLQPPKNRR